MAVLANIAVQNSDLALSHGPHFLLNQPSEMLYISTDEKDRSFFAPFERAGYTLRFIKDIAESVGLNRGILADDPNFIGMVEQIVASKGRVFVGTW